MDGIFADRRTGRGDNIWTVSARDLTFLVEDQTVVIKQKEDNVHLYGEVSEPAKAPLYTAASIPSGTSYLVTAIPTTTNRTSRVFRPKAIGLFHRLYYKRGVDR